MAVAAVVDVVNDLTGGICVCSSHRPNQRSCGGFFSHFKLVKWLFEDWSVVVVVGDYDNNVNACVRSEVAIAAADFRDAYVDCVSGYVFSVEWRFDVEAAVGKDDDAVVCVGVEDGIVER